MFEKTLSLFAVAAVAVQEEWNCARTSPPWRQRKRRAPVVSTIHKAPLATRAVAFAAIAMPAPPLAVCSSRRGSTIFSSSTGFSSSLCCRRRSKTSFAASRCRTGRGERHDLARRALRASPPTCRSRYPRRVGPIGRCSRTTPVIH